ncbi:guanine nucleotide exchange family protein [Striga asiatica]|uniref:Guanine nucleotide exchange family protein n=1 Tax=Striga asiatica TaxID=4170 RepID=A0A5A7RL79_STRAF|nr:guanine nucleotide exchange family protein [Striga asiatica]
MSSSQTLGGASRCGWVLGPSLDKIVKNAAWRKHAGLVSACKSALDKLDSLADDASDPTSCAPLYGLALSDAEFLLHPVVMALDSGSVKVVEPALDCVFRLFSFGLIRGCEIEDSSSSVVFRLIDSVCKCAAVGDEAVELAVLKVLLSAVRSPCIYIRGTCLVYVVRSCYNVYLGGRSGTNQICAKSVLAQMMVIVFTRVEENSMLVDFKNVSVFELLEFADRNLNEGSSIQFAQNFINEIVEAKDSLPYVKFPLHLQNDSDSTPKEKTHEENEKPVEDGADLSEYSKIREDGFMLFKNLGKLSMKFSSQENPDDQILLRGKILSLELLNVIMGNAGPIWRSNERQVPTHKKFVNAVKQYLCMSLLKNSALSVMTVFQLLCSIFWHLLSKFRSGLKSEIGIFFPMLILRVLENVLQPSFLQKMTVLNLLEKIAQYPQLTIDTFVNYDCDVEAPNIFERTVNGLLKTALGPSPGSVTSLSPVQDMTFRHESVKCLAKIIKSMGSWMDQQLKVSESNPPKVSESENLTENPTYIVDDTNTNSELLITATLEQCRAYKVEIQKGVALFNRKPSKGIEFLISAKRVGNSPEEVASFLKSSSGLNESMIGDYFGEREEFPMKVMHAYVDSFNFENMSFAEAIRFFLRGFRLPGETQKIDRIMEKFAERYCKCNPSAFTSADTAYVLAYSVIILNTDAHNSMVKDKMSKADFIRNNRGIDNGKDLPEDYLGALYDQVVKNEIKMNAEPSAPQSKHGNSLNKLLGLDGILNLVWKPTEEKPVGANGYLLRHIQEQFKAKSAKSEVFYYAVADPSILRFMVEVCWGPMLAAFSTQRDAFVTTVAKFTNLHCAADMKQKNVDAVKINYFISNLYLLDQIGNFELNHIFAHNQRLNSEAIVAFVKSLCKVSMAELQSPTDPRVFSLTKIVEVAHYNMNRIRLVWSRIWNVLSEFFVSVGLSENLSVAIFVMDSLRQLAMKFLEREELVNYNFQNEFLRPFTIVMQKSNSTEIRELIVRCISQMVLSRVDNIKSGWKSVFMVFTAAAADERKSIVLLAFETIEKIGHEYFPYITETEALTFTDCVKCLITFTNSKFNSDVSLNAIAFLRYCAAKLADGGLSCNEKSEGNDSSILSPKNNALDEETCMDRDGHMHFWIPLLTGLSNLTSDPRAAIRKSSLEVLFNILKDHGHLFSQPFWATVFKGAIFPIFTFIFDGKESDIGNDSHSPNSGSIHPLDGSIWDSETSVVAVECLTDLFVNLFDLLRPQFHEVISIIMRFVRSPSQSPSTAGVAALMRLSADLRSKLTEEEWQDIFHSLEEAAVRRLPVFMKLLKTLDSIEVPDYNPVNYETESSYDNGGAIGDGAEDEKLQSVAYIVSRMKVHISLQLLIIQVTTDLYKRHWQCFSPNIITILLEILSSISSHAHELNSETILLLKLDKACTILEISNPPLVHFEIEAYMNYLNILHDLLANSPSLSKEKNIELELISVCKQILETYLECSEFGCVSQKTKNKPLVHFFLPLGSAKKEELAARTPLVLSVMRILSSLESASFRKYISQLFPLLTDLVYRWDRVSSFEHTPLVMRS